jgi:cobalt transporter subunit CbtB
MMQMELTASRPRFRSLAASRSDPVIAAAMAALLGGFLIWAVGFSHIDVLHNAAHDTRHSMAFPCH